MISISLCMIVKNEEDTLGNCLSSCLDLFDEIIIVDTGSTDNTKKIAKEYTNKIYDFKWCDDFSKARNFSFSKATKDYIMWLDADDIILPQDMKKLKKLKNTLDNNTDMVMLKYNLGNIQTAESILSYYRERIVKRNKKYKWISPIHEVIVPKGNILYANDIAITHNKIHASDPKRNLRIFEKMKTENYTFDARQTFYYARELYYAKEYDKAIKEYLLFLNMKDAWIPNIISACIDLHYIYLEKNKESEALSYLFKTFEYDIPSAEVCCHIANIFMQKKKYAVAIYWYKEATKCKYDISSGGFLNKDYYGFIPYIQLCVCYYAIGDISEAMLYNKKAGRIKPNNSSYLYNVHLFENSSQE